MRWPRWRWTRSGKIALWVVVAAIAVPLLYVVAANIFLKTRLLRGLTNKDAQSFFLEYRSATTLWPGKIHATGVRIRFRDSSNEVGLVIDDVTFRVDLFALFRRTFHARDVHAVGAEFRLRPRLLPAEVHSHDLTELATIEGYADPPLADPHPRPPITDDNYRLWSVELDGVDVQRARQIWIERWHYQDEARVRGALFLKPARQLVLFPSTLEASHGAVRIGGDPVALDVSGTVDVQIDPVDPRAAAGAEVLRFMTFVIHLGGRVDGLDVMRRWVPPDMRVSGGIGSVQVDGTIVHSAIAIGSTGRVETKQIRLQNGDFAVDLRSTATFAVTAGDDRPIARMVAEIADVTVRHHWATAWPFHAGFIGMQAHASNLTLLQEPFHDMVVSADMPKAELAELRALNAVVAGPTKGAFIITGGKATFAAHVDVDVTARAMQGEVSVDAHATSFTFRGATVRAGVRARAKLTRWNLSRMHGDLVGSTVDLADLVVERPDERSSPWWAKLELTKGGISGEGRTQFLADVSMRARDARPFLLLFGEGLPGWVRDLFALEGLSVRGRVLIDADRTQFTDAHADGARFTIDGEIRKTGAHERLVAMISSGPLAVGIQVRDGERDLRLLDVGSWFRARVAEAALHF